MMMTVGMDYKVVCARIPGNELVAQECYSLTGGESDCEGVANCYRIDMVANSAFLRLGVRTIAEANTLTELVQKIKSLSLHPLSFRISFLKLDSNKVLNKSQSIMAVSDAISSAPDLRNPDVHYMLGIQKDRVWLGEVLIQNKHLYQSHDSKPYRISSSLPSRLARALVNLVVGRADSILDPFCGSGSILLEAQATGLQAYGMDVNPKMVGMTRQNLAYFKYSGIVELGDAGMCKMEAGAIVTDLPYGRELQENQDHLRDILPHLSRLAPVAVYVSERDISDWLTHAGYENIRMYKVRKRLGMCRIVHMGYSRNCTFP